MTCLYCSDNDEYRFYVDLLPGDFGSVSYCPNCGEEVSR